MKKGFALSIKEMLEIYKSLHTVINKGKIDLMILTADMCENISPEGGLCRPKMEIVNQLQTQETTIITDQLCGLPIFDQQNYLVGAIILYDSEAETDFERLTEKIVKILRGFRLYIRRKGKSNGRD